ncbi:MAG: AbrB/MazE/SpoVT family DNA-binding domain-containing protein [Candidatus Bipolaricaulia bacterium]
MTIAVSVKLGKKGQMVLPKKIRDALGLKEGDSVIVTLHEKGQVVLTPPEQYAALTRGMLKGTWGRSKHEIEQYLQRERESWGGTSA